MKQEYQVDLLSNNTGSISRGLIEFLQMQEQVMVSDVHFEVVTDISREDMQWLGDALNRAADLTKESPGYVGVIMHWSCELTPSGETPSEKDIRQLLERNDGKIPVLVNMKEHSEIIGITWDAGGYPKAVLKYKVHVCGKATDSLDVLTMAEYVTNPDGSPLVPQPEPDPIVF